MKKNKLILSFLVCISLTLLAGCNSRNIGVDNIDLDVINRLPEEQRNAVLNEELVNMRRMRKEGITVRADGSEESIMPNGTSLPGQSENIPSFNFTEADTTELYTVVYDYLVNELGMPEPEGLNPYNLSISIDPRMNAIYDAEYKGVAEGFENENIYIVEFETEIENVYSFLILVRDFIGAPWRVIHNGTSFLE